MRDSHNEVIQSGKHLMEALAGTFAALTSGYAEFHQAMVSQSHQSIAVGLTAAKEVLTLKSPYDWNEFQTKWACEFIGTTAVNAAHVARLSVKLTEQTCGPLRECLNKISGVA